MYLAQKAQMIVMIAFGGLLIYIFSLIQVTSTELKQENLSTTQNFGDLNSKLDLTFDKGSSGGLFGGSFKSITYTTCDKDVLLRKTISYSGNVRYVKGDKNMISYTISKNCYGDKIGNKNIMIEYDETALEVEKFHKGE